MPTAHVTGFEHDIFISYSTRDDIVDSVPTAGRKGRVSTLAELLILRLTRILGPHMLWFDRDRIDGQFELKPSMERALGKTAIMVAILSPGYHASDWCKFERERFLESIAEQRKSQSGDKTDLGRARVFVVEFDRIEDDVRPKEFSGYYAHRFWIQDPLDPDPRLLDPYDSTMEGAYKKVVDALASALAKALGAMKRQAELGAAPIVSAVPNVPESPPPAPEPLVFRPTVYLAETTDDLYELRHQVKVYLEQQGIAVVPGEYLHPSWMGFKEGVVTALQDASMFVQLLSLIPGRRIKDTFGNTETTFAIAQYDFAREEQAEHLPAPWPILQWRDLRLTGQQLAAVPDPAHRALLEGPDVQAVPIEEFKQNIVREIERVRKEKERQAAKGRKAEDKLLFVLAHRKDGSLARRIKDYIEQQGFPCGLPCSLLRDGNISPSEVRDDLEINLQVADGTIVVHGGTPELWCKSQLIEMRKIQRQADRRCEKGIYLGPPPPKNERIQFTDERVHVIKGYPEFDEDAVRQFLDAVAKAGDGDGDGEATATDGPPDAPLQPLPTTRGTR